MRITIQTQSIVKSYCTIKGNFSGMQLRDVLSDRGQASRLMSKNAA